MFFSYLDRIYPVSSVAMNVYLPTAADYEKATWHGVVPTGSYHHAFYFNSFNTSPGRVNLKCFFSHSLVLPQPSRQLHVQS